MDLVVQPLRSGEAPRLACFDMDSTLIEAEVIDELARRHGVGEEVAEVTERAMRGELDFKASFRERMSKLEGLEESVLANIAAELPLMEGVERLLVNLKRLGLRTVILSGGLYLFRSLFAGAAGFRRNSCQRVGHRAGQSDRRGARAHRRCGAESGAADADRQAGRGAVGADHCRGRWRERFKKCSRRQAWGWPFAPNR